MHAFRYCSILIILVGVTITGSCELVVVIPVLVEGETGTINELDTGSMDKGKDRGYIVPDKHDICMLFSIPCVVQFIYSGFISILGITFEALLYADIRLVDKSLSLQPISFRYIRYPVGIVFENSSRQSILHSQASTRNELFLKHLADSSCCCG